MKLTDGQKKIIDIIQWVCIIVLLVICVKHSLSKSSSKSFISDVDYQKEQTYVKIYESQKLESLKKRNKELYDSIKALSNVESAVEIRYVYKYETDTIKVTEFVYNDVDSIYHYASDNDTIKYEIDVKAQELKWLRSNFSINDKFRIINRELDGQNQMFVEHGENVTIENVDAWHRIEDNQKQKWYNNFHVGFQLGVGYGLIFHKPDVFVGFGVSYDIK